MPCVPIPPIEQILNNFFKDLHPSAAKTAAETANRTIIHSVAHIVNSPIHKTLPIYKRRAISGPPSYPP